MAAALRLANGQLLDRLFLRSGQCGMLSVVRPVTMKNQPAKTPPKLGHDERNMRMKRPQSPHLTIYAPQWTSMLSISHRATGMVLAGYIILFSMGTLVLPDSISTYIDALANFKVGSIVLTAGKFVLAFPLTYHFWNGIRHLFWDLGMFLALNEVYTTGYLMLCVATGSAALVSVI